MGCGGDEGGGGRSCNLNFWGGGCTMRDRYIGGGGDKHGANSECTGVFRVLGVWSFPSARSFCVFVSRHKFYVCDFRTKHKICILAYHNLCFCVFVFLGMLHYLGRVPISFLVTRVAKYVRIVISRCPHNLDLRCMVCR